MTEPSAIQELTGPQVGIEPVRVRQDLWPATSQWESAIHSQWVYRLGNGWGLSVIAGPGTYSGKGTYEAMLAKWASDKSADDDWTAHGDPAGHLTTDELVSILLALSQTGPRAYKAAAKIVEGE